MKKIPTMFIRDETTHLVTSEPNPLCDWVFRGEGVATRKLDGTACLWMNGKLWKRLERWVVLGDVCNLGVQWSIPGTWAEPDWRPAQSTAEGPDKKGRYKVPGWVPVGDGPEDRWHREAVTAIIHECCFPPPAETGVSFQEGVTYELIGPKINGYPDICGYKPTSPRDYQADQHLLVPHRTLKFCPWSEPDGVLRRNGLTRSHEGFLYYLSYMKIEGLVFHHPDGRMAKIKRKDLGLPWPVKA